MEMQQVLYFRALSEVLNFTKAAQACHVSQPALTRSIRLLEEEFGGPLFHRERSNTHLSELGKIVKPHLDSILEQVGLVADQARNYHANKLIKLRLGIMCTIAPANLIQLIDALRTRYTGINLEVFDAGADEVEQRLLKGELDVAILHRSDEGRLPTLHYLSLFLEQFMIVTARGHALSEIEQVRIADLKDTAYLQRVHCEFGERAGRVFKDQGVNQRIAYSSDRDDWILAMAAAGMGYAFMPEYAVAGSQVVKRPLVEPEFWRDVSLATVRGRPHSPAVGAFIHEAMRGHWPNGAALAVQRFKVEGT